MHKIRLIVRYIDTLPSGHEETWVCSLMRCWRVTSFFVSSRDVLHVRLSACLAHFLFHGYRQLNPLNPELNPICYLLALLGAHHFLHVGRIRVKLLTFRRLMSYIYMEHSFLMFLDHSQRRSTVGRTPLDE